MLSGVEKPKNILVVCTGNQFRSPIAEAFIRDILNKANLRVQIEVHSAGIEALPKRKLPNSVIKFIREVYSIDLSQKYSEPLTFDILQNADLILVMEQEHLNRLSRQYPRFTHRIHFISELSGRVYDIIDPIKDPNVSLNYLANELYALLTSNFSTLLKWLKLN